MPFYQYRATDSKGLEVTGTLQARSLEEASTALFQRGFKVTELQDAKRAQPSPGQRSLTSLPPVVSAPAAVQAPRPARPQETSRPTGPVALNSLHQRDFGPTVKTKPFKDRDIFFLFTQLASYMKSGINPAQAFHEVGNRAPRPDYREAFHRISAEVAEGKGIADVLSRYPYLFAPHVVGMCRAGETGGYLPEVFTAIADQADASRRFRRWFVWLGIFVLMMLLCIPAMKGFNDAAIESWHAQERSGGTAPGFATFFSEIGKEFLRDTGIITLIVVVVGLVFSFVWQSMPCRTLRHRLTLWVPTVGKRAKAESLAAFSWNLGMISRTGIAPRTAYMLAVESMPNLAMRDRFAEVGSHMSDQTRLSEALRSTNMLPFEYAPMVETGELTGDVPGQLFAASRATEEDYQREDKVSRLRVGCWMLLTMLVGTAIMFGMFYGNLYPRLFRAISGE